jgi:AsmA family protein
MTAFFRTHKWFSALLICLAGLMLLVVLVLAFFDWNLFRPAVARAITAKTGRPAAINGDLRVHAFSLNPHADIQGLTLKNPSWAAHDTMLSVKDISITVSLARLLRGQLLIPQIIITEPVLNLERDAQGRASWELGSETGKPNNDTSPTKLPAIRRLIIQDGKLEVEDAIRKLKFGGTITASDAEGESALAVKAKGTLNAKPFTLDANGASLIDLTPEKPYPVSATIAAGDIHLKTRITVRKPFDFGLLDVDFTVSGHDLADVFYLTGLALPNTPPYRFAATLHVAGITYHIDDFHGQLGDSDLSGRIEVVNRAPRPKFTATLTSKNLNIADLAPTLGEPAPPPSSLAATDSQPKGRRNKAQAVAAAARPQYLLPDADLQMNRVRGMDADVRYQANSVSAPKVPMKAVEFHLTLQAGLLKLDPLAFVLDQGKFSGTVQIDARKDTEVSDIDMHVDGIDLSQFRTKAMKTPPMTGTLAGRVKLHGTGSSVHKFASNAAGSVAFVIPQGEMTSAFAELTGIDITRALGLLVAKNEEKTPIRCSVIDFQANDGDLAAKTLFIDTTYVLINGKGNVDLKSERLDLQLRGDPKKLRLTRIRSPILLRGTLEHPTVGVDVKKLAGQGAVASALGVLLTPAAAILAFIDPGLAKNKDCASAVSSETAATIHQ